MKLLEIPTATLAYDERGSGRPVVLLPSGAHVRRDYDELRERLPARLRTIALDWPGHGDSPAAAAPTTAMFLADVAEAAVERLAPDGAIVLGNSVGGFAAARLAVRRPELVAGLVIVDGGGFARRGLQVRTFCALMSQPRFLRAVYPGFSALYMRARTDADRRARAASIATTRRDPGLRAVAQLWRSFASPEHDLRAHAGSIAAPTLVVWGRRDPVIPLRAGRRIAGAITGASLVVLDTGHVPYTSAPDAFADALVRFADAAPAGAAQTTARATA
jgi:pimeloyl-ACP methyl ester carboxylesterase